MIQLLAWFISAFIELSLNFSRGHYIQLGKKSSLHNAKSRLNVRFSALLFLTHQLIIKAAHKPSVSASGEHLINNFNLKKNEEKN